MARALAFLTVAERLDFVGQTVLFVDGDPFENLDALLQRLDLVAQAQGFGVRPLDTGSPIVAARAGPDDRCDHYDRHDDDGGDLAAAHWALSSIRSRSRNASICEAVSTPRSV